MGDCIPPTGQGLTREAFFEDMKKFTLKEISSQLERDGQSLSLYVFKKASEQEKGKRKYKVWQDEYHPKIIYTDTVCRQKLRYMHGDALTALWECNFLVYRFPASVVQLTDV